MSLIFFLFYWLIVPVLTIYVAMRLWRRQHTRVGKGIVVAGIVAGVGWLLWMAAGEKMLADMRVSRLCAEDGGIRVYETVGLPAERFDKYGQLRIPSKEMAKPDDQYYYVWISETSAKGRTKIRRDHFLMYRHADQKLLGESISYARTGGDLPGPWHGSAYRCPERAGDVSLENQIFRKE